MLRAEVHNLQSNDHLDWSDFERSEAADLYDAYGWFHITIGAAGIEGGNDFQLCVATRRAVSRVKRSGAIPGLLVDRFDATTIQDAIKDRISAITAASWEQLVDQLRTFMLWEYEGMK